MNHRKNSYYLIIGVLVLISLAFSFYLGRKSKEYDIVHKTKSVYNNQEANRNYSENTSKNNSSQNKTYTENTVNEGIVPTYVIEILHDIRKNNKAPEGYVGGRTFQNREQLLPKVDANGNAIKYQEWDVHPKIEGQNRGSERLVTSQEEAYYTQNHYRSFTKIENN